jgi:hypothetical protein
LEAVPPKPRTVLLPRAVYFTWLPAPPEVVAAVRVCGEGANFVGCFNIAAFLKLPLANDTVPTTVPVIFAVRLTEIFVVMTILSGPAAGKVYSRVEVPVVPYVVPSITTVMAPAGSV